MHHRDRTLGALEHVGDFAVIVHDCVVGADDAAGAAIDAHRGFDVIDLFREAGDCAGRTALFTGAAAGAVFGDDRKWHPASFRDSPRLLPHLVDDSLAMAVLDKLIVAAALLQRDVGEEHHQDHHRDDRDVVGHGEDFEKLLKPAYMLH